MSDLHRLPLRGHDLPEAPRRARVQVRSYTVGNSRFWYWEHACGYGVSDHTGWESAFWWADRHVRQCAL